MKRLVLDRLWPMLTVMAVLIVGALALQEYAKRRGNQTLRIVILDEAAAASADDEGGDGGGDDGGAGEAPVSDLHAKARTAARRGHVAEALPLFERALAADPDAPGLLVEAGFWLTVADRPGEALPLLERADRLRPTAWSAYRLGGVRRRLDDAAGAEREFRRAIALQPSMAAARISLGNLLRRRGALGEAATLLEAAAQAGSNEDRARALVALGATHVSAGRREAAELAFERAINYAPARAEIRIGIARAWLGSGRQEDAERALKALARASEVAPDLPAVWYALARARERVGDAPGAREAYDRVLRLDPANRAARRRTIRLALQTRDLGRARQEADRLLADGATDPENLLLAASVADRDGRRDDARRLYQSAITATKGSSAEAWLGLGQVERAARATDPARAAFRKALDRRPGFTAAWLALGRLEEAAGRPAEAEKAFRSALAADEKAATAWLALGQLLADQKRTDDATAALRKALEARPGYPAAELSLGVTLARAGRFDEAIAAYRALVAREPRYVSAWFNLGLSLRKAGRTAEAAAALVRAGELDAGHLPSRRELADLHLAEGRIAEAKAAAREALDVAPGDVAARVLAATIAAREGDRAACVDAHRRLRAEAPDDPRVTGLTAACAATPARGRP